MANISTFSKRIKELRDSQNLSQKDFAKSVGTTQTTLSSYENTNKTPSLEIIKNIAAKYLVSIDWLLGLTDSKTNELQIQTYADLYKIFFLIDKSTDMKFLPNHIEATTIDGNTGYPVPYTAYIKTLYFNNTDIENFLDEWEKMKTLHNDNIIDDEVYSLWKEKTLKKASKQNLDGSYESDITFPF